MGARVKIPTKHIGILDVPPDKHFWELPISHYKSLVNKIGYKPVINALVNLEVWNRKKNPDISSKAKNLINQLHKIFRKEENMKESYQLVADILEGRFSEFLMQAKSRLNDIYQEKVDQRREKIAKTLLQPDVTGFNNTSD